MDPEEILLLLPYSPPFLFVDRLRAVTAEGAEGSYRFPPESFFYRGHFIDLPVTPGVILTECMAQIGVVSIGIFLLQVEKLGASRISLSSTCIDFFHPVFPGEEVQVISEKIYFRFNKLKCSVKMKGTDGRLICKGEISGMMGKQ